MSPEQVAHRLAREVVSSYYDPPTADLVDELSYAPRR
jgi:hypothetical protein